MAGAAVDQTTGAGAQSDPATFVAGATDFPTIQASVQEAGMPRAMPSDYAAAQSSAAEEHFAAGQLPSGHIASPAADDSMNAIENVRAGGSAIPDPDSAIENVRATRAAPEVADGGGGIAVDAPSAGVTAALAGGAALTIAAAAFALRRRREPEPA
jgi:hypothetical protein